MELNMATPADQRLLELLDKWLKSLELHRKYAMLDDGAYASVQPWPEHQRPSRWIIDLAMQKALALRAEVQERMAKHDSGFAESLELMSFLANLLGAEHIERFIPLADAETARSVPVAAEVGQSNQAVLGATATREMPTFVIAGERSPQASGSAGVARIERKKTATTPVGAPLKAPGARTKAPDIPPKTARASAHTSDAKPHSAKAAGDPRAEAVHAQVIADAARLVQWGRKWYELAELISSMADRPSLIEVRRILKDNKTVIDKKAGRR